MIKKTAKSSDENDQTLESTELPLTEDEFPVFPVVENEIPVFPAMEAEIEALTAEGNRDRQDICILELKVAELEDMYVQLQTVLNILINKKQNKKKDKKRKVKCKCKDKKVQIPQCKCKSKK